MKRELIKNLSDAKAGSGHKKNKSDSNLRRHVKNNFSLLEISQADCGIGAASNWMEIGELPSNDRTAKVGIVSKEPGEGEKQKESKQRGHQRRF